jgi:hypothetical protein
MSDTLIHFPPSHGAEPCVTEPVLIFFSFSTQIMKGKRAMNRAGRWANSFFESMG